MLILTEFYAAQKGLWHQPIATITGFIAIDIATTLFAYSTAQQRPPSIPNDLRHLLFFSLFNPLITWSAIGQLLKRKPLQWRQGDSDNQRSQFRSSP